MKIRERIVGLALTAATLCAVAAGGCGGGEDGPSAASAQPPGKPGSMLKHRPEIEVPAGLPPKHLVVRDIRKGSGKKAEKGDRIALQYYGVEWNGGLEHANSFRYEGVPTFEVGEHRLLRGLNLALRGMKEGGTREVIIPYDLVYYPDAVHRELGVLDALIYKIHLVKVFQQ